MENQEFEEEDDKEDIEGEEEDSPGMVYTVSTATATAATLALQPRRSLGPRLHWMEQVKRERLRQVNGGTSRLGHLSPTALSKGHSLPSLTVKGKSTMCMFCLLILIIYLILLYILIYLLPYLICHIKMIMDQTSGGGGDILRNSMNSLL